MRVKCLAQEHNTMSLARVRTQTARFGVERTNHEATTVIKHKEHLRTRVKCRKHEPKAFSIFLEYSQMS